TSWTPPRTGTGADTGNIPPLAAATLVPERAKRSKPPEASAFTGRPTLAPPRHPAAASPRTAAALPQALSGAPTGRTAWSPPPTPPVPAGGWPPPPTPSFGRTPAPPLH